MMKIRNTIYNYMMKDFIWWKFILFKWVSTFWVYIDSGIFRTRVSTLSTQTCHTKEDIILEWVCFECYSLGIRAIFVVLNENYIIAQKLKRCQVYLYMYKTAYNCVGSLLYESLRLLSQKGMIYKVPNWAPELGLTSNGLKWATVFLNWIFYTLPTSIISVISEVRHSVSGDLYADKP